MWKIKITQKPKRFFIWLYRYCAYIGIIFFLNARHTALSILSISPFYVSLLSFLFYSLISLDEWFFDVSFTFRYQAVNIGLITESNLRSRFIPSWQSISIAEKRHQCLRYVYNLFYEKESFLFRRWYFICFYHIYNIIIR